MAKINKKQEEKSNFYPQAGTAFCDRSSSPKIVIIESEENLAVIHDAEDGWVAVHSLEDGYDDFQHWLQAVKDESIDVVWCPVMKRVSNNKEYLKHWKLA